MTRTVMSGASPAGLLVTCAGRLLGRPVTYLSDVVVPASAHAEARALLRAIATRAVTDGDAAVLGWFAPGSGVEALLRSAGFRPVPPFLRPRPYTVWGSTDLGAGAAATVLDLTRWHMTLADSDLA